MMNELYMAHMLRVYDAFEGDIETAIILGVIGHYSAGEIFARGTPRCDVEVFEKIDLLKHCNALSISQSTGIPRETTRRKIKQLEQKGWLCRDQKGRLLIHPSVGEHFQGFNEESLQIFLRATNEIQSLLAKENK